jgi:hypothetical protein
MREQQSVRPAAPRRMRGDRRKRTFAILSIAAFLLLNLGIATGRVAIVVVLSGLTSGVTVVPPKWLARWIESSSMSHHNFLCPEDPFPAAVPSSAFPQGKRREQCYSTYLYLIEIGTR